MAELSESEKATFKAAGERRRARGVVLRKFSIMAEESQVEALNELYDAWVSRFGKEKAIDHWIVIWSRIEARMQDADQAKKGQP
jgi:hypothetical protein